MQDSGINSADSASKETVAGGGYTLAAFLIWGLSPIYFKALKSVAPFEILMHRVIWSFIFLLFLIGIQKRWKELGAVLRDVRKMPVLMATTLIVAGNWFLFIWAINNDHILQVSLGYYINPLLSVFLGMVFLKERLRPLQVCAVFIAGTGVGYLTVQYGAFPWLALIIALTFGLYTLIRKVAPISALIGLFIELLILFPPAAAYLIYLDRIGAGAFMRTSPATDLLLVALMLVTAVPLLLFTMGARRLNLSTVGFMQYITPSCAFILAVFYYREPMAPVQWGSFIMIWIALAIYSADAYRFHRR